MTMYITDTQDISAPAGSLLHTAVLLFAATALASASQGSTQYQLVDLSWIVGSSFKASRVAHVYTLQ